MWQGTIFRGDYAIGTNTDEFEVGWAYLGESTPELVEQALNELLDVVGREIEDWHLAPQVRSVEATVIPLNFGRGPIAVQPASWCVYGVATKLPAYGLLREGVRMPLREDMQVV